MSQTITIAAPYQDTTGTATRASLAALIASGAFVLDPALNHTDFGSKCYSLAVIDPSYTGSTTIGPATVNPTGLCVAALQYGDALGEGSVTLDGYSQWFANYNNPTPTMDWEDGCFTGTPDAAGSAPLGATNYLIWAGQFSK